MVKNSYLTSLMTAVWKTSGQAFKKKKSTLHSRGKQDKVHLSKNTMSNWYVTYFLDRTN